VIRTVEVVPPSQSDDEELWVVLGALFVCLGVIYVFAFQLYSGPGAGDPSRRNEMLAFQVLFRDLPGQEQRVYRSMTEGLDEALRLRSTSGSWPTVESLAEIGIPPFALDVLDKSSLVWERRQEGLVTEYVGVPARETGAPSFLILVQEPEPGGGEDASTAGVDEEHQLLPNGKLLHVTYWEHRPVTLGPGVIAEPALQGWRQIRVTSPFQSMEAR
jgi:hypothetical protein